MDKLIKIKGELDDLGNISNGGQGSVHKARRQGEILTVIKRYTPPIEEEGLADRNHRGFQKRLSEVESVNREPHPHVVQFLSSGISELGNYRFIEMELVEGPHLEQLRHSRFDPVFPIHEILKVAEHLSAALSHWHKAGIIHGDVKSDNVRYDARSGNYILVDFAWLPLEQQPGVTRVENSKVRDGMAPEEGSGQLLFQTDIYRFGLILFELVLGQSFLQSEARAEIANGHRQTAAYLGTPPHEFITLRKKAIPLSWPLNKVQEETMLPEWFVLMIYKCLDKDPESRFENGMLLHQYILENKQTGFNAGSRTSSDVEHDYERLLAENLELKQSLEKEKHFYKILHGQWKALNDAALRRESEAGEIKNRPQRPSAASRFKSVNISRKALLYLVSGIAVITFFAAYLTFRPKEMANQPSSVGTVSHDDTGNYKNGVPLPEINTTASARDKKDTAGNTVRINAPVVKETVKRRKEPAEDVSDVALEPVPDAGTGEDNLNTRYKVKSKAYFYNLPHEETRRNAFIIHWNNAVLSPLEDKNGFIYIVFTNHLGQTSRGWLRKKDLSRVTQKG